MNIFIPRAQEALIILPSAQNTGRFKFIRRKANNPARVVFESAWTDNIITNIGLDMLGTFVGYMATCMVGTDNTTASATDTQLYNRIASTTTQQAKIEDGIQGSPPYYGYIRKTWRFGEGVAAGNLSEVAVGIDNTNAFSRALIADGGGSPTTITVLPDEYLDVIYELRCYPPTEDVEGTITLGGNDYDYVLRAASVSTSSAWGLREGGSSGPKFRQGSPAYVSNGSISTITGTITGTALVSTGLTNGSYTNSTYRRDTTNSWDLNSGNAAGGISALQFGGDTGSYLNSSGGRYQMSFSPAIPKDNTKILSLTFRQSWARKTL